MKLFLCLALLYLTEKTFSQEKIFEYRLPEEFRTKLVASTTHFYGGKLLQHYLVATKNKIRHIYLSQDGKQKEIVSDINDDPEDQDEEVDSVVNSSIISYYRRCEFLLHIPSTTKSLDLIYLRNPMKYYIISTDMKTGNIQIEDSLKRSMGIELVSCYFNDNAIIFLHHLLGKNDFVINTKKIGEPQKIDTVKIEFPKNYSNLKIGNFTKTEVSPSVKLFPYYNLWIPPLLTDSRNTAFQNKEHLIILVNEPIESTFMVDINIITKKYSVNNYSTNKTNYKTLTSSWIAENFLITSYAQDSAVNIFVYDYVEKELVNSISINKDNFEKYATSRILKTGDFWSRSNVKQSDFEVFLKKANANRLLFSAYKMNNELFFTLTTKYDIVATSTFLGNIVTLGVFDFRQAKPVPTLSFDVGIKLPNLQPSQKETKNFVWEKIYKLIWAKRFDLRFFFINFFENYYYVTHFDQRSKKIDTYRYYQFQ